MSKRKTTNVQVPLTSEQLEVLDYICSDTDPERAHSRAETMRYALQKLAMVYGLEWPDNLASHGDFARARTKRWSIKEIKDEQ